PPCCEAQFLAHALSPGAFAHATGPGRNPESHAPRGPVSQGLPANQGMHRFPNNKKFAFSVFDDTDLSTVENVSAVYRLLDELGIHTTKSVWPLASSNGVRLGGATLQDPGYLDFVMQLRQRGFEIALHSVRNATATRQEVRRGLEEFRRLV